MNLLPDIANARAVVMCGISGSGKTVFSQSLERRGFIRVSADELLWAEYGAEFANMPVEQQRRAFMAIGTQVNDLTARLISEGKKVVVDSTMCKRFKRDEIRSVCRALDVEPVFVYLETPYQVLHDRLAGRQGTGPNDQIVPDCQLRNFCNNFEAPGADENVITIEQK